jgi:hypothetical protein
MKKKAIQPAPKHYMLSGWEAERRTQIAEEQRIAGILPLPKTDSNPMCWGQQFDFLQTGKVEDRRGVEGLIAARKPGAAAVLESPFLYFNDEPVCGPANQGACG